MVRPQIKIKKVKHDGKYAVTIKCPRSKTNYPYGYYKKFSTLSCAKEYARKYRKKNKSC